MKDKVAHLAGKGFYGACFFLAWSLEVSPGPGAEKPCETQERGRVCYLKHHFGPNGMAEGGSLGCPGTSFSLQVVHSRGLIVPVDSHPCK